MAFVVLWKFVHVNIQVYVKCSCYCLIKCIRLWLTLNTPEIRSREWNMFKMDLSMFELVTIMVTMTRFSSMNFHADEVVFRNLYEYSNWRIFFFAIAKSITTHAHFQFHFFSFNSYYFFLLFFFKGTDIWILTRNVDCVQFKIMSYEFDNWQYI